MKKLIAILVLGLLVNSLYSQERVIYGDVTFMDYPVKNVIVKAKNSKSQVTTDNEGNFAITIEGSDVLIFETENFEKVRRRAPKKGDVNIDLALKRGKINEHGVILNNYMDANQFEVALYKSRNVSEDYSRYSNIYELLRSKFPMIKLLKYHDASHQQRIVLRGLSSIQQIAWAMLVVNGTVVDDISYIQPNDVKDVKILSSIEGVVRYGGEARGGVVVITTKTQK